MRARTHAHTQTRTHHLPCTHHLPYTYARARAHTHTHTHTHTRTHTHMLTQIHTYTSRTQQACLDKLLKRAKRIITNYKTVLITNEDFNTFGLVIFSNIKFLSVICQDFKCVHSDDFIEVFMLRDINKFILARASQCNKAFILTSKKACHNCFCLLPLKRARYLTTLPA